MAPEEVNGSDTSFIFTAVTKNDDDFIEFKAKHSDIVDQNGTPLGTVDQTRIYLTTIL